MRRPPPRRRRHGPSACSPKCSPALSIGCGLTWHRPLVGVSPSAWASHSPHCVRPPRRTEGRGVGGGSDLPRPQIYRRRRAVTHAVEQHRQPQITRLASSVALRPSCPRPTEAMTTPQRAARAVRRSRCLRPGLSRFGRTAEVVRFRETPALDRHLGDTGLRVAAGRTRCAFSRRFVRRATTNRARLHSSSASHRWY